MVSTPVINVNTSNNAHLPTAGGNEGWVGLVSWVNADSLPTKWSRQGRESPTERDRHRNHWATTSSGQAQTQQIKRTVRILKTSSRTNGTSSCKTHRYSASYGSVTQHTDGVRIITDSQVQSILGRKKRYDSAKKRNQLSERNTVNSSPSISKKW